MREYCSGRLSCTTMLALLLVAECRWAPSVFAAGDFASPGESTTHSEVAGAPVEFKPRKPAEMRQAVSDALRAESSTKVPADHDKALRQLMLVYLELEQDKNLTHDERLELHTEVRSRLESIEKSLRAKLASGDRTAKRTAAAATRPTAPASVDGTAANVAVLAQQVAGLGGGAPANPPVANPAVIGRLQSPDYGQNLVDLIQNVIAPRTWDVNGGPGSVVYFRNFRVLVVRAPAEVQTQVGDVLGQLRK
jgi:hypothetical protein